MNKKLIISLNNISNHETPDITPYSIAANISGGSKGNPQPVLTNSENSNSIL